MIDLNAKELKTWENANTIDAADDNSTNDSAISSLLSSSLGLVIGDSTAIINSESTQTTSRNELLKSFLKDHKQSQKNSLEPSKK